MKRPYNKKSSYWQNLSKKSLSQASEPSLLTNAANTAFKIEGFGTGFYDEQNGKESVASCAPNRRNSTRENRVAVVDITSKYDNIDAGLLPYQSSNSGFSVRDAIILTQKAYFNIMIFRNSVDLMAEFSNSDIYLKGGNAKAKRLINAWLKRINVNNLKDQFFREYYRSGNVFLYRIDGNLKPTDYNKLVNQYESLASNQNIPVRYILVNPAEIVTNGNLVFNLNFYKKVLSTFEIEKLRAPSNEHERELLKSLSKEVQQKISAFKNPSGETVEILLDPKKLTAIFNKKQDYEPLAVPLFFPVLDDLNKKLEFKKIDQAIARTVHNVILLVTMGAEPEKGGINHANVMAMQEVFRNESVGRVLVSDYTTKAEFIIPDLKKVLGKEKYEILNEDIKEGLQNIVIGQEKFSNTEIKAEIFLERLKQGRLDFVDSFLQPEVNRVCQIFGLKDIPKIKMKEVSLRDSVQLYRLITRMAELGIITPEQMMGVINNGPFPTGEEVKDAQESYLEDREKGFYNPIVGGIPVFEGVNEGMTAAAPTRKAAPTGGRPLGNKGIPLSTRTSKAEQYSVASIIDVTKKTTQLQDYLLDGLKKKFNRKKVTKADKELSLDVAKQLIIGYEMDLWESKASEVIEDFNSLMTLSVSSNIEQIAQEHSLDTYSSALLYHSTKLNNV